MDIPAKLATQGTQDEKSPPKTKYITIFVGSHHIEDNTNAINKTYNTVVLILLIYILSVHGR